MIEIGTLVKIGDLFPNQDDLGLVVGYWEDPHDGYFYLTIRWLDDWQLSNVEPCCLEVL